MNLLIDIGNTHTVAGWISSEKWNPKTEFKDQVRYRTDSAATSDEYRSVLNQLFLSGPGIDLGREWKTIQSVVVSSVVPMLDRTLSEVFGSKLIFVDAQKKAEFRLKLPHPEQLGADRLANVAGALALHQTPLLIVDAGTATTFCLVDGEKNYIGGSIVPGLETSWRALQSRAAKLYSVELRRPSTWIGNTTETQLQSGVLGGYESLIEGLSDRLISDAGPGFKNATWIATGGIMNLLKLTPRFKIIPDLTLIGLKRYAEWNA
ncbi:MAG: type III pantothenate kinase [Bdellovibrionales bacterium]|nr:type III pantothenate kinase [Bdellovibrionales bacterium]